MRYARVVIMAVLAATGSVLIGWWSAGVVGALRGLGPSGRGTVLEAGAGAALGWGMLLAGQAVGFPIWRVAADVGAVFGVPAVAFVAVTLLFGALLAGSGAAVVSGLRRRS